MKTEQTPLERARTYEREADVQEQDRPLFHLTPRVGWMNDPNGFCVYQGRFHLFYQYHPYDRFWGPMHWGHAHTRDFLHWTYEPCALAPDTDQDAEGCFSGTALPLKDGRLMLLYTGVGRGNVQAQCMAVGDGRDFEKCPLNPVVRPDDLPEGYSAVDFRDPRVWEAEDGSFRLAVANRHRDRHGTILFFSGKDGIHWDFRGEIDASRGEYGKMWECPDFFRLQDKQVLMVSPQEMHARDEFHPGYGTVAILGDWEEETCRFSRTSLQTVDHGLNFYAPQTLQAPDGRRIMTAWMENWETCGGEERRHAWYGQMICPRELSIRKGRLYQEPVREIRNLWRDEIHHDLSVREEVCLPGVEGRLMDMTLRIRTEGSGCRRFTLQLARDAAHTVLIHLDPEKGEMIFDRSHDGSLRDIVHTRCVKAEPEQGEIRLRILMDRESVELFLQDGARAVTSLIHNPPEAGGMTFSADAPVQMTLTAHPLS